MSNKGQMLQDPFLNTLRKEHVQVSIYLVNGIKLQGVIESFDQFVVLLRNTVSQMVYKHAISTIVPGRNVRMTLNKNTIIRLIDSTTSGGYTWYHLGDQVANATATGHEDQHVFQGATYFHDEILVHRHEAEHPVEP